MTNKTILVTGGAGFIGSHLCSKLIENNCFVYCVDNLSTGSKKNINHLLSFENFKFIEHDITCSFDYDKKINEIYNLACPASPIHYQKDPIKTIKTNVLGSINMLDFAQKIKAKILQASTSEVYGDPLQHPQVESYFGNVNPIGVRSCYDEGKRCAETLFFDYFRQKNLNIKVARIFNTYGPKMQFDDGRVVSNFIVQCLLNEAITIYGNGSQTRSFCYVDDMVDGLIKLMNTSKSVTGPLNLGNTGEISIKDLSSIIVEITKSKSSIRFLNLPQDDPKQRKPNIDLAYKEILWLPKVGIYEGLTKTIKYFKENL